MDYIGSENIFRLVFGNKPLEGKFKSPFREDITPGCFFWDAPGVNLLLFVDYGDLDKTHYNAVEFIQKYYNLSTKREAIDLIREKFKGYIPEQGNIQFSSQENRRILQPTVPKVFRLYPRQWNNKDKIYWTSYGITKQQLIEDGVIPITYYQIYEEESFKTYQPYSISYAYTFPEEGIVKIYSPEDSQKWITNANNNIIGNIQNIDKSGDKLIITKSYKDCRVLRNLGYKNVIWFQSESQSPRIDILLDIIKDYKSVVIFYDNDETGLACSARIVDFVNNVLQEEKLKSVHIPLAFKVKDISDYYEKYQENQTITLIKKIIK